MKELPKYFVIQQCDNPLWSKYIDWLNKTYKLKGEWNGLAFPYYGYDGGNKFNGTSAFDSLDSFANNPTLLTLEEWDSIVNPNTLKVGDEITICGIKGCVSKHSSGYFINTLLGRDNAKWFKLLGIDKSLVTNKAIGYCDDRNAPNIFPYCKTLEDLTKLVNYLKEEEIRQKSPTKEIDLSKGWIVECKTTKETNNVANFVKGSVGWSYFKYVINHLGLLNSNSKDYNLYDKLPKEVSHLPVLNYQQFESLILNKKQDGNKNNSTESTSEEGKRPSITNTSTRTRERFEISFGGCGEGLNPSNRERSIRSVKIGERTRDQGEGLCVGRSIGRTLTI